MRLRVLGVGFGRTGTLSLKQALETLGVGPCYHMMELATHRAHADSWLQAALGEPIDWEQIFAGYAAAVDWPAAAFWREILAVHRDARVILTVRDATAWYASFRDTILDKAQGLAPPKALPVRSIYDVTRAVVLERTFGGRAADMRHAIEVFESHNRDVLASIPQERLLVCDLAEGWAPLCAFLGLPTPAAPFPHANSRAAFQRHYADLREQASGKAAYPTSS
jgi:Sulfotransferase domain